MNRLTTHTTLLAGLAIVFSGCVTKYGPSTTFRGGFSDIQIDDNTYRVNFRGNEDTPLDTVETYMLYRCAELTADLGYDYFVITRTYSSAHDDYMNAAVGTGFSGSGVSVSTGTEIPFTNYAATAFIEVFQGEKPETEPEAYDAQEVLSHLGPTIRFRD